MKGVPERLIRSIVHRRRLADDLPRLEIDVLRRLDEAGMDYAIVGPYLIRAEPSGLDIIEREPIDASQMALPFWEEAASDA